MYMGVFNVRIPVYVHICVCTPGGDCIYSYIHTSIHMYVHMCAYMYAYVYIYMHICACVCVCRSARTYVCIHADLLELMHLELVCMYIGLKGRMIGEYDLQMRKRMHHFPRRMIILVGFSLSVA